MVDKYNIYVIKKSNKNTVGTAIKLLLPKIWKLEMDVTTFPYFNFIKGTNSVFIYKGNAFEEVFEKMKILHCNVIKEPVVAVEIFPFFKKHMPSKSTYFKSKAI